MLIFLGNFENDLSAFDNKLKIFKFDTHTFWDFKVFELIKK